MLNIEAGSTRIISVRRLSLTQALDALRAVDAAAEQWKRAHREWSPLSGWVVTENDGRDGYTVSIDMHVVAAKDACTVHGASKASFLRQLADAVEALGAIEERANADALAREQAARDEQAASAG